MTLTLIANTIFEIEKRRIDNEARVDASLELELVWWCDIE